MAEKKEGRGVCPSANPKIIHQSNKPAPYKTEKWTYRNTICNMEHIQTFGCSAMCVCICVSAEKMHAVRSICPVAPESPWYVTIDQISSISQTLSYSRKAHRKKKSAIYSSEKWTQVKWWMSKVSMHVWWLVGWLATTAIAVTLGKICYRRERLGVKRGVKNNWAV